MKIESSIQKSKSTQFTLVLGLFFWTQFRLTQDWKYLIFACLDGIYKAHSTKSMSLGALELPGTVCQQCGKPLILDVINIFTV